MYIEELKGGGELGSGEEEKLYAAEVVVGDIVVSDAKRVLIGVGARALFYPTLLYNVVRNKFQTEFRWWDWIDEFVLLGAVPFPSDVKRLKELGVCGVITLNEPYETLVPSSLYQVHDIDHLVLPTRDYLFAPLLTDLCQAVDFIHENASSGQATYVHCKAGRGRSTTVVICYLVQHRGMTPDAAYAYVKSIRPRVLLASSQWQAVQEYYHIKVKNIYSFGVVNNLTPEAPVVLTAQDFMAFDDGSVVVVTKADLDGYDANEESVAVRGEIWAGLGLVCGVQVAGQTALARLSCLWLRCHTIPKISTEKLLNDSSSSVRADRVGGISVDIHVY